MSWRPAPAHAPLLSDLLRAEREEILAGRRSTRSSLTPEPGLRDAAKAIRASSGSLHGDSEDRRRAAHEAVAVGGVPDHAMLQRVRYTHPTTLGSGTAIELGRKDHATAVDDVPPPDEGSYRATGTAPFDVLRVRAKASGFRDTLGRAAGRGGRMTSVTIPSAAGAGKQVAAAYQSAAAKAGAFSMLPPELYHSLETPAEAKASALIREARLAGARAA